MESSWIFTVLRYTCSCPSQLWTLYCTSTIDKPWHSHNSMSHMMADSASTGQCQLQKLMKHRHWQGSLYCIWTTQCVTISLSWQNSKSTVHLWGISWESCRNCSCTFRSCNWNCWLWACKKYPQILAQKIFYQAWTGPRLASMNLSTGILNCTTKFQAACIC